MTIFAAILMRWADTLQRAWAAIRVVRDARCNFYPFRAGELSAARFYSPHRELGSEQNSEPRLPSEEALVQVASNAGAMGGIQ
jgi:hypothetical protein